MRKQGYPLLARNFENSIFFRVFSVAAFNAAHPFRNVSSFMVSFLAVCEPQRVVATFFLVVTFSGLSSSAKRGLKRSENVTSSSLHFLFILFFFLFSALDEMSAFLFFTFRDSSDAVFPSIFSLLS